MTADKPTRRELLLTGALSGTPLLAGCSGITPDRQRPTETKSMNPESERETQLEAPYDPTIHIITASYTDALFELELNANNVDGYAEIGHFQIATGRSDTVYIRRVTPLPVVREDSSEWVDFGREMAIIAGETVLGTVPFSDIQQVIQLYEERQFQENTANVNMTKLFVGQTSTLPEEMVTSTARFLVHLTTNVGAEPVEQWEPSLGYQYRPEDQDSPTAQFAPVPLTIDTKEFCTATRTGEPTETTPTETSKDPDGRSDLTIEAVKVCDERQCAGTRVPQDTGTIVLADNSLWVDVDYADPLNTAIVEVNLFNPSGELHGSNSWDGREKERSDSTYGGSRAYYDITEEGQWQVEVRVNGEQKRDFTVTVQL